MKRTGCPNNGITQTAEELGDSAGCRKGCRPSAVHLRESNWIKHTVLRPYRVELLTNLDHCGNGNATGDIITKVSINLKEGQAQGR